MRAACLDALVVVALAATSVLVDAQAPQTQTPTFRSEINYVEVPVRVVDERGDFVRGLAATDFAVFENGTRQVVARFSERKTSGNAAGVAYPSDLTSTLAVDDDVLPDSRVYVLLVDDLLLEPSRVPRVRDLLERFILEKMSPEDLGAVALTSNAKTLNLTRNKTLLLDAVSRVAGRHDPELEKSFTGIKGRRVRAVIEASARSLGTIKDRRKALIVVSSKPQLCMLRSDARGRLLDDGPPVSCAMMFEAAVQSGVSIYMLDPRGLVGPSCAAAEWSGEQCAGPTVRGAVAAWSSPQSGMRTLSEETGGFAMVMSNSFDAFFDRIVRENSAYYLIGYYSTNDRPDGRLRSHQIKVNRAGLNVSHRAGYLAPRR